MVNKSLTTCIVLIAALLLGSIPHSGVRDDAKMTIFEFPADGSTVNLDTYCQPGALVLFNSGSTTTVVGTSANGRAGQRCSVASTVDFQMIVAMAGSGIFGPDGTGSHYYYVDAADDAEGVFLSLVCLEAGKWTVERMYGSWSIGPP